jgi:hypothetical protein
VAGFDLWVPQGPAGKPVRLLMQMIYCSRGNTDAGLDQVLERLEFGLPTAVLPLAALSVRLTRGQCLALARNGVHSVEQLNALSDTQLRECVGQLTAARLRPRAEGAA